MNSSHKDREANPKQQAVKGLVGRNGESAYDAHPARVHTVLSPPGLFRDWHAGNDAVPEGLASDELIEWGKHLYSIGRDIAKRERQVSADRAHNDSRVFAWVCACKEKGWTFPRMSGSCGSPVSTLENLYRIYSSTEGAVKQITDGDKIPKGKRELVAKYPEEHQREMLLLMPDRCSREEAIDVIQAYAIDHQLPAYGPQFTAGLKEGHTDDLPLQNATPNTALSEFFQGAEPVTDGHYILLSFDKPEERNEIDGMLDFIMEKRNKTRVKQNKPVLSRSGHLAEIIRYTYSELNRERKH